MHAFKLVRKSRSLQLAFLLCLVFAGSGDTGHQHGDLGSDPQCYACHFSPDTALLTEPKAAAKVDLAAVFSAPGSAQPAFAAALQAYKSRAPPLLV